MKTQPLPPDEPACAGVVRELHGMLNWLLIAAALLLYAVVNRLLLLPVVLAAASGMESVEWPAILALTGVLLMLVAVFPAAWHLLLFAGSLLKLRADSPPAVMDHAVRRMRLLWRAVFSAVLLGGVGYVMSLSTVLEEDQKDRQREVRRQKQMEELSRWRQAEETGESMERAEAPTEEQIKAQKHAEYIRKLEEEYYRQKREREAQQKK
jgi:hypothetical protein